MAAENTPQRSVLLVDDTPEDRVAFRRYLTRVSDVRYIYHEAETAAQGQALCRELRPDVVLLDYSLPDGNGLTLLSDIVKEHGAHAFAVVMLTGYGSQEIAVEAMKLGAHDYLVKDREIEQRLSLALTSAIEKARLQRQIEQQQRELAASNSQLRMALQAANMATWMWDLRTNQVRWGDGLEQMLGMSPGAFGGTHAAFLALVHPDDRAIVQEALNRALQSEAPYMVEFRMVRPDGGVRWTATRGDVVRDANGAPISLIGIDMDITERKRAEANLRASEERLRYSLHAAAAGSWNWDISTGAIVWSPENYQLHGRDPSAGPPTYQEWVGSIHPDDLASISAAIQAEQEYRGEYRVVSPDGRMRWLLGLGRVERGADGKPRRMSGLNIDITDRKQAEEALRESEARLQLALAAGGMGTFVWHVQEDRSEADQRMLALFGLNSDGALSLAHALAALIHPSDRTRYAAAVARALDPSGDGLLREDIRVLHSDRSEHWLTVIGRTIFDGAPRRGTRIFGMAFDITEHKRAEAALRSSEERLRAIWESASDAMALSDPEGIILSANPAYCSLYGYAPEQVIGESFALIFPPDQRQWAIEQYREIIRTRAMLPAYESSIQREDGDMRIVESRAALVSLGEDKLGMLSIIRDITDRTLAEHVRTRLLEQERLAREAAELTASYTARLQRVTAALGATLMSEQVTDVILNEGISALEARAGSIVVPVGDGSMLKILGAIGYPPHIMRQWQQFPLSAATPLTDAIRLGQPILLESREAAVERYPQLKDMTEAFDDGAILAFPLRIGERVLGGIGISTSHKQAFSAKTLEFMNNLVQQCAQALERAQLYQTAQQARVEAEEAVREREAFFSIAAHEIRNPLTILSGHAQLLLRRADRTEGGRAISKNVDLIVTQAQRINALLGDMLDMARLGGGQLTIERTPLDLATLIRDVAAAVQMTTSAHTIVVQFGAQPLRIAGDAGRLEQVFHNLVSNAVKYSPAGGTIAIDARVQSGRARVDIVDSGIGIPAEALPYLFRRFYRVEREATQHISGLGIGLYVVKEIVAAHGGTIEVVSDEGAGSTFTVWLPELVDESVHTEVN